MTFPSTPPSMLAAGWVTCQEAASVSGRAVQTLYRWVDSGKVEGCRTAGYRRFVRWSSLLAHLGAEAEALGLEPLP